MMPRSRLLQNVLLLVAAVAVFGIAAWIAMRVVEPIPPPPVPPAKNEVTFDPRVDVRNHPLFSTLQTLTRGKVTPTVLGRSNPFLGSSGGIEALKEGADKLGTIEEISLSGAALVGLSKGAERGVIALVQGPGQNTYEVRRLSASEPPTTVGTWSVAVADAAVTPVAVQEDRSGTVWLLSAGGRIGSLQRDGKPLWGSVALAGIQTAISPAQVEFALDGAGRLWFTDGASVFVGNGIGFERIDIAAQLSATNRQALSLPTEGAVPADALAPQRLQMLADGRIAVLMKQFMVVFPLNLQGGSTVMTPPGSLVTVEPNGALWSVVRGGDGAVQRWVRTVNDGAREFTQTAVLPKQSSSNPRLAAVNTGTVYSLDYVPGATILWSIFGDAWAASALAPTGTQPQDQVTRIVADRDGMVWGVLAQRGLLLLKP